MNHGWTPPLLQLSHQDPAICHAVIANGIMSRRYQENALFSARDPQAIALYRSALQQYGKAVACFRSQLAGTSVHPTSLQNAPACCVLLILFEFMQGNAGGLLLHLRNATRLVASLEISPLAQSFVNFLALIDMIAMTWLNLDQPYSTVSIQIPKAYPNKIAPARHSDLEILTYDLVNIKNEVMAWRHTTAIARRDSKALGIDPNKTSYELSWQSIQSRLKSWDREFMAVSPTKEDIATHHPSLLRANYLLTVLIVDEVHNQQLSAQPLAKADPVTYAGLPKLGYFYDIIEITEAVLEAGYSSSQYNLGAGEELLESTGLLPLFSFRNSFIQPLFYVGQKAPCDQLRRRATRLLLEKPWREGAWDSFIMGSFLGGEINVPSSC